MQLQDIYCISAIYFCSIRLKLYVVGELRELFLVAFVIVKERIAEVCLQGF